MSRANEVHEVREANEVHEAAEASLGLDAWLGELRRSAGFGPADPPIDRATQRALLDLTRVAAHRSERIAAPITAYLVGLAAAAIPEPERAAWIERLVAALERPGTDLTGREGP